MLYPLMNLFFISIFISMFVNLEYLDDIHCLFFSLFFTIFRIILIYLLIDCLLINLLLIFIFSDPFIIVFYVFRDQINWNSIYSSLRSYSMGNNNLEYTLNQEWKIICFSIFSIVYQYRCQLMHLNLYFCLLFQCLRYSYDVLISVSILWALIMKKLIITFFLMAI